MQRLARGSLAKQSFPRTTNAWALTEDGMVTEFNSEANKDWTTVTTLLLTATSYPWNDNC